MALRNQQKNKSLAPPLSRHGDGTQELAKKTKKTGVSSLLARNWQWHLITPISNPKKKKRSLGSFSAESWQWSPHAPKSIKTKGKIK